MQQIVTIPRELLREPSLPIRVQMDDEKMETLVSSIRIKGVMVPLLVRPRGFRLSTGEFVDAPPEGDEAVGSREAYEISDGHRRYIACGMAGVADLPCIVRADDPDGALDYMVTANLQREDNTAAEEGWLYMRLVDEKGWGIDQLMRTFHQSGSYINDRVRLVTTDGEIAKAVANKQISFTVSKALCRCTDEAHRRYLLSLAITHGANARTAEAWIQDWRNQTENRPVVQVHDPQQPAAEYIPPAAQVCLWCEKDRDRDALVQVVLHRWHLSDLLDHLEKTGIRLTATSA